MADTRGRKVTVCTSAGKTKSWHACNRDTARLERLADTMTNNGDVARHAEMDEPSSANVLPIALDVVSGADPLGKQVDD
jgi:hypothetical protein